MYLKQLYYFCNMQITHRKYGKKNRNIVLIHGGPGAPGGMKPLAENLSECFGILEPFQSEKSIEKQVEELHNQIEAHAQTPAILIGHSWGAWLAIIYNATYPKDVEKLILIGTPPFEEDDAAEILIARQANLTISEGKQLQKISAEMYKMDKPVSGQLLSQFEKLMIKADSFKPAVTTGDTIEFQPEVYKSVWAEAQRWRKSGEWKKTLKKLNCPITAIHGQMDPHSCQSVQDSLMDNTNNMTFCTLPFSGHYPWKEADNPDEFFALLAYEIENTDMELPEGKSDE